MTSYVEYEIVVYRLVKIEDPVCVYFKLISGPVERERGGIENLKYVDVRFGGGGGSKVTCYVSKYKKLKLRFFSKIS